MLIACSTSSQELLNSSSSSSLRQAPWAPVPVQSGYLAHYVETITNTISWLSICLEKANITAADAAAVERVKALPQQIHRELLRDVLPAVKPDTAGALLSQQQVLDGLKRILPLQLVKQLCELGGGVCALLPLPYCCNNPSCSSLQGVSEVLSVKTGRCSGCKVAHCQKQHWDKHKSTCKRLKGQPEAVQACRDAA